MRWGPVRSPLSFCRLSFLRETRKKPFSAKNIKYEKIFLNYFPQSFRLTCFLANSYSLDQPKHRVLHTLSEKWTRYNQRLKFIRKKGNSVTLIDFFLFSPYANDRNFRVMWLKARPFDVFKALFVRVLFCRFEASFDGNACSALCCAEQAFSSKLQIHKTRLASTHSAYSFNSSVNLVKIFFFRSSMLFLYILMSSI